jgi:hypothetical protein
VLVKVEQRHDEILVAAFALAQLDVHDTALQPVLSRERLPSRAVRVDVRAWLRRRAAVVRRPDAFQSEPGADHRPALAPGGRGGGVGDVEGAVRGARRVQRSVDAEARDDVLGAVC